MAGAQPARTRYGVAAGVRTARPVRARASAVRWQRQRHCAGGGGREYGDAADRGWRTDGARRLERLAQPACRPGVVAVRDGHRHARDGSRAVRDKPAGQPAAHRRRLSLRLWRLFSRARVGHGPGESARYGSTWPARGVCQPRQADPAGWSGWHAGDRRRIRRGASRRRVGRRGSVVSTVGFAAHPDPCSDCTRDRHAAGVDWRRGGGGYALCNCHDVTSLTEPDGGACWLSYPAPAACAGARPGGFAHRRGAAGGQPGASHHQQPGLLHRHQERRRRPRSGRQWLATHYRWRGRAPGAGGLRHAERATRRGDHQDARVHL